MARSLSEVKKALFEVVKYEGQQAKKNYRYYKNKKPKSINLIRLKN